MILESMIVTISENTTSNIIPINKVKECRKNNNLFTLFVMSNDIRPSMNNIMALNTKAIGSPKIKSCITPTNVKSNSYLKREYKLDQ
ncbi:MAG: hypothetical protein ACFFDK_09530 [Promethearchaeota archaeon]